jgi:hypothetical protein
METLLLRNNNIATINNSKTSDEKSFITANTEVCSFEEIRDNHIIPVFMKDSEPLISCSDFIDCTLDAVSSVYHGETILKPSIRVSHPIKGRVPDAKDKPASQLEPWEKTIYYERCMFVIEIPTVTDTIGGNTLSLTVGGVKAYNLDNLYNRKGADEHFKIFIGFQNKVCCNLCVWSDGYVGEIKVHDLQALWFAIQQALQRYNPVEHIRRMSLLENHQLTGQQFANIIGRFRMYQHLPLKQREGIPPLLFGDQQIGSVCKDYYRDQSFCRDVDGSINLWRFYNLLTGANKTTYIDSFMDRSINAFSLADGIRSGLDGHSSSWFLN